MANILSASPSPPHRPRDLRMSALRACALVLTALGTVALAGWVTDLEVLRQVTGSDLRMKPNLALGLCASGLALQFLAEPSGRRLQLVGLMLSLLALAIGCITLGEYVFGPGFSIDEWLMRDPTPPLVGGWTQIAFYQGAPGRMAPLAAAILTTGSLSLGMRAVAWRKAARWPAWTCLLLGALVLMAMGWNVTDRWLPRVPWTSTAAFLALGLGATLAAGGETPAFRFPKKARFGIEASVLGAFFLVTLLLLIAGRVTYHAVDGFAIASEKLADSQSNRIAIGRAFAALNNVESSQRAYLLTSDPKFRAEYLRFEADAGNQLGTLPSLVFDPRDAELVMQMGKLANERLRLLDGVLDTFEKQGLAAAQEVAVMRQGSLLVSQLRGLMDRLDIALAQEVVHAQQTLTRSRRVTLVSSLASLAGSVAILCFVFAAVRREMIKRTAAQAALAHSNEQLERARAEADQANVAKSAFLATMSHEIRTPMNGVIGMVEVLAQTALSADQAEAVTTIHESGNSLLELIDEILDFSKIESGRIELERGPVALVELAENVRDALAPLAAARAVDLHVFVDPHLPSVITGDETRLRQILNNLVGNAIKFSGGGGLNDGKRGCVQLCLETIGDTGDRWQIRVADNGIGMSEAVQQRLFAPFSQGEASITRRFGGTGLGLAICKGLVHEMGGSIAVTSAAGKGATFGITLPLDAHPSSLGPGPDVDGVHCVVFESPGRALQKTGGARVAHTAPTGPVVEAARPGDRLVLVAEDDSVNQKVILKQLAILGFAAEIAADGAQALRLWRTKTYSALVTDLHMPEMDGYALARAIRAEEPGDCHLPILAVSADALRDTESHALDAGIDAYLTKPVQLQRLGATLEACMAQGRAIAPKIFQAPEPIHERVRLDPSALRELVGDDSKVIVEFLSDFGRSLPRLSGELQELMQAGDRRRLASFAHRLKSTSFSMGSGALGEVCADLENAAPRCSEADLSRLVGAVHEAMDDAARAIAEYLEMLNSSATL